MARIVFRHNRPLQLVVFGLAFLVIPLGIYWRVAGSGRRDAKVGIALDSQGVPTVRTIQCPGRTVGEVLITPDAFGERPPVWTAKLDKGASGQTDIPIASNVPGYAIEGSVEGFPDRLYLTTMTDSQGVSVGRVVSFTVSELRAGFVRTTNGDLVTEEAWRRTTVDCTS